MRGPRDQYIPLSAYVKRPRWRKPRVAAPDSAGSLLERDGDRTWDGLVDGEEVAVIGDEVPRGRLHRVGSDHRRDEALAAVGIGDQGVPFGVDVERYRPH